MPDKTIKRVDCHKDFIFTEGEQQFYEDSANRSGAGIAAKREKPKKEDMVSLRNELEQNEILNCFKTLLIIRGKHGKQVHNYHRRKHGRSFSRMLWADERL